MPTPSDRFAQTFDVSRETVEALEIYADLLRTWQRTINLVAPATLPDLWHRHMADSAQVYALWRRLAQPAGRSEPWPLPSPSTGEGLGMGVVHDGTGWGIPPTLGPSPARGEGGSRLIEPVACPDANDIHWLDLGSGGGFPGLVVGIMGAGRGIGRLTLIDSDQRKCAFLREVARATGLKGRITVDIVTARIEDPANHSKVGTVDVVSARALSPLPKLIGQALPFFGPSTLGLFLKGQDAVAEVEAVPASSGVVCEREPSLTEAGASIVVVRRRTLNQEAT
jgi:16S rRNA (guanine527-N7)-methyltransferase